MLLDGEADAHGGVTFHRLTAGIDEGPIVAQRALPFSDTPHFATWDFACARAAAEITRRELPAYLDGTREAIAQDPSERFYRSVARSEFTITTKTTLAAARHLFACAPGMPPRWQAEGEAGDHSVHALAAVLGPPSGAPPVMGLLTIEADIADARIRLWRGRLARATYGRPFLRVLASRLRRRG